MKILTHKAMKRGNICLSKWSRLKGETMIKYNTIAEYENERYQLVLVEVTENAFTYYATTLKDKKTLARVDKTDTWRDGAVGEFNQLAYAMGSR